MQVEAVSTAEPPLLRGEPLQKMPEDLYIPPDALRVFLESFQGPLDLLLYLIKRQNLDILEIPILQITQQYMQYIDLMHTVEMNLAGEYLLMAATLADIKSRFLLPKPPPIEGEEEEIDPKAALIRRLQEYECFKLAAERLDECPRQDRDVHYADADAPPLDFSSIPIEVELSDIRKALSKVLKRAKLNKHHKVLGEALSVRARMTNVLDTVSGGKYVTFESLFSAKEGRLGIVVTLIAVLELARESLLEIVQNKPSEPIYVKGKMNSETEIEEEEGEHES